MLKNVQTTAQSYSFYMLAMSYSKSSMPDFSSKWTKKFQVYKLGLEKAEESDQIANIHWIIEKAQEF